MTDQRAQELVDLGNKLFSKKEPLNSLMQEIALQFYPARATFTMAGDYLGRDHADHLHDSYPVLVRRELGNAISATLRPRDQQWFRATTLDEERDAVPENARYLDYVTSTMRTSMYDMRAKFVRATKEGDHDYITFGQTVISVEEGPDRSHLYYRANHLRDCAWLENDVGEVDHLHRKDRMSARNMMRRWSKKCHKTVEDACKKEPGQEFNIRCIQMPSDEYDYTGPDAKSRRTGKRHPFIMCYLDADNGKMLAEIPSPDFIFVVPRWQTLPGLQYAVSPATSIALPDGRLAQSMALMILEAGEKAIDPPIAADGEVFREFNLQSGAMTWADLATDRKITDAFTPININPDMRTAFAMRADLRDMLAKAFFIDKLALPEATDKMTATEIRARLEEHVRNLLPLFEPMEHEYNGRLLDKTFFRLRLMRGFDTASMPDDLSGANISWGFKNPLQEASTRILAAQFREALEIEAGALQAGVSAPRLNVSLARDDAIRGIGVPAKWRRSEDEILAEAEAKAQAAATEKATLQAGAVAQIAQQAGDAAQSLQVAGLLPALGGQQGEPGMQELPDMPDIEDAEFEDVA